MPDFISKLRSFSGLFDSYFYRLLDEEEKSYRQISEHTLILLKEIRRVFESGGKRLRPAQLFYSYLACGGRKNAAALKAAVPFEMLHTFAVIHDDILDKSETRRGLPTSHKYLNNLHVGSKFNGDASHFGLSGAILSGDLALALADKSLTNAPFPRPILVKCKKLFDDLRTGLVAGEFLDIYAEYLPVRIPENYVMEILKYKSGYYTCGYPLRVGAVLAEAPAKIERALFEVGEASGVAFQIQDDILGVFGNEKQIGKSVDSDLIEGKKTLLVVKAYELAKANQKIVLDQFLGSPGASHEDLNKVRQIIKDTGAYEYAHNKAAQLIRHAQGQLSSLPLKKLGKEFLTGLTQFLLDREF
jgi:geranylgeranyl diphosphate synthase type I